MEPNIKLKNITDLGSSAFRPIVLYSRTTEKYPHTERWTNNTPPRHGNNVSHHGKLAQHFNFQTCKSKYRPEKKGSHLDDDGVLTLNNSDNS